MNTRTVLLYGRSLLISLVADSLKAWPDLSVARATSWEEARLVLAGGLPDVLIFDLAGVDETHVLPLLLKRPDLTLIGLDPERNQAVQMSWRNAHALTLSQLGDIVAGR